jgi:hypothetical protein
MKVSPALYLLVVVVGLVAGFALAQRTGGVFACQANGYVANQYLAYCGGNHYGDYDHGAFWLDLEPLAQRNAAAADALFIGNSRLEIALSSPAADEWFERRSSTYYLMGFMYDEPMAFTRDILRKLKPKAKVYVINLDSFFRNELTEPAQFVETDRQALSRYAAKRRWQSVHSAICGKLARLCGRGEAWYRARNTGALTMENAEDLRLPADDIATADPAEVARQVALAEPFVAALGVPRNCVLYTLVPMPHAPVGTAREIAAALHGTFIAPEVGGLMMRDGSHLDEAAVDRWSREFFRQAGPALEACLGSAGSVP